MEERSYSILLGEYKAEINTKKKDYYKTRVERADCLGSGGC